MPAHNKPLTKAQLVGYFNQYREKFADWAVEHDVMLTRTSGPVKQMIDFQALRSGAYRPSCAVAVLPAPETRHVLNRWLDIRHREV